jgi:hypothetical protein
MRRRRFLGLGAAAGLALAQNKQTDEVTATATQDTTPRVGIVLSSFKQGAEHDGTEIKGLDDPRPPDADLTSTQIDAMVRRAIDLAATRAGDFASMVEPEDWVVVKTHILSCYGLTSETKDGGAPQRYIPGSVTDPRIVRSVVSYLAEQKRGLRFTIVEGSAQWLPAGRSKSPVDGWTTEWGGAFDGLSYRKMIEDLTRRFPKVRFEIADLNFAESIELPVPGKAFARNNPSGVYSIPKVIQQCDRVISVAPMKTDSTAGVSLSVKNYLGIAPGSKYGFPKDGLLKLGSSDEVMIDLFSYHPADFAIVGGCWGVEGDGPDGPDASSVHHNIAIAGVKAICVDAVAASIMGFNPSGLPFLTLGDQKGFGIFEVDSIWTRGNDIDEARRNFRKPSRWRPSGPNPTSAYFLVQIGCLGASARRRACVFNPDT